MSNLTNESIAYLSIHHPSFGPSFLFNLKNHFSTYANAAKASYSELKAARLNQREITAMNINKRQMPRFIKTVEQLNIQIILFGDKTYPYWLAQIKDRPAALYVRGQITDLLALSVVGSRRCSSYGQSIAYEIATQGAQLGMTIVSGLAYGIDTIAHEACLKASGRTMAVLAGGIETVYPRAHNYLVEQIIGQGGALISEYPLFTPPYKQNFLIRNRIIAGLSSLIVVVEAGDKSGALSTAREGIENGREVYAVPADITRETAIGSNRLLREGAAPYLGLETLVNHYSVMRNQSMILPVSEEDSDLINLITPDGIHINHLAKALQLDIADLSSKVILLELKGLIKHEGSGIYRRLR